MPWQTKTLKLVSDVLRIGNRKDGCYYFSEYSTNATAVNIRRTEWTPKVTKQVIVSVDAV